MLLRIVTAAAVAGLAAYPFIVLLLTDVSSTLTVALLALLGSVRVASMRSVKIRLRLAIGATLIAFCGLAWFAADFGLVKLYPVIVSLVGMTFSIWTLAHPPSAAERFAKAWNPAEHFDERKRSYTRRVTQAWAGFFLVNGIIAAYTAVGASTETWAVYNGFVSYLLIGILFGGEYAVRRAFHRKHYAGPQSIA